MANSGVNIDISPSALMMAAWELPSLESGRLDALDEEEHAKGMRFIRQMIEAGADQSREATVDGGQWSTTPIIVAAANNDSICLAFLLSAPFANPDFIDQKGRRALAVAACHGYSSCVEMLAPVSNPNIQDAHGNTALASAMSGGHSKSVAILAQITDLSARNLKGETARQFAERCSGLRQYLPMLDSIVERRMLAAATKPAEVELAEHPRRKLSL